MRSWGAGTPSAGPAVAVAVALVAGWLVVFGASSPGAPRGPRRRQYVLPPLAALVVPVVATTALGWWREPWLLRPPPRGALGLLVPVVLLEALVVLQLAVPPGVFLLAFLVTGASEELLTRGVVQRLLQGLPRLPQVLLSGGLLAIGYVVTLRVLGFGSAKVALVAGTVLCFGVAHAALRRRGVPVVVLAADGRPRGVAAVRPGRLRPAHRRGRR